MKLSLIHTGTNNHSSLSVLTALWFVHYNYFCINLHMSPLLYHMFLEHRDRSFFIETKGIDIWSRECRIHVTFRKQSNSVWLEQTLHCSLVQHIKELDFILKLDLKQKCDVIRCVSLEGPGRWCRLISEIGRIIDKKATSVTWGRGGETLN